MNILETKSLTKAFGGVIANKDLDIAVKRVHYRTYRPQRSGKTTFINVVSGVHRATSGKVYFNAKTSPTWISIKSPAWVSPAPFRPFVI